MAALLIAQNGAREPIRWGRSRQAAPRSDRTRNTASPMREIRVGRFMELPAGDHDASCASDARLPGGWDHSLDRLEAHGGTAVHHPPRKARSTGLTGRPCFEV